jgi:diguanylate cyclase (GGDEF)-like protein
MSSKGSKSTSLKERWRIIDNLLDAVFVVDRKSRLFYANESFRQLCEVPRRAVSSHEVVTDYLTLPEDCWNPLKSEIFNESEYRRYREVDFKAPSGNEGRAQVLVDRVNDDELSAEEDLYLFVIRDVTVEARLHAKYRSQIQSNENLIHELQRNLLQTVFLRRMATDLPMHAESTSLLLMIADRMRTDMGFRDAHFFRLPETKGGEMMPLMSDRRMGSRMREVARTVANSLDLSKGGVARVLSEKEGVSSVIFEPFGTYWLTVLTPTHEEPILLIASTGLDSGEVNYKSFLQTLAGQVNTLLDSRSLYIASITDPLTNLFNRRFFDAQLAIENNRALEGGHPLSLMMIDVDHFKQVNDVYGHQMGDTVLRELGRLIKKRIRNTDFGARVGGEEFALILPDTISSDAKVLAESLRKLASEMKFPVEGSDKILQITISLGISASDLVDRCTPAHLYKLADEALYMAKTNGRNRFMVCSDLKSRIA